MVIPAIPDKSPFLRKQESSWSYTVGFTPKAFAGQVTRWNEMFKKFNCKRQKKGAVNKTAPLRFQSVQRSDSNP